MEENPKLVLVFSGKRKSGKDYVTDILKEKLGESAVIMRLSGPLKECYARDNGLDFEKLLSPGDYKEKYRLDMLRWSEEIRNRDYTYFCKAAISKYEGNTFPIWIISDARRLTDLQFFRENYGERMKIIRVVAPDSVRSDRGWVFTSGVDDKETECGLDSVDNWDFRLENDGTTSGDELTKELSKLAHTVLDSN